jgi:hypothetical protein
MNDFEYRPLSELPHDANPVYDGGDGKYSFGTDVFGGSNDWIVVENGTDPVKVYKLPVPVSRILRYLSQARFDAGRSDAQEKMRLALGRVRMIASFDASELVPVTGIEPMRAGPQPTALPLS